MNQTPSQLPNWMHYVLRLAGWYNIVAGLAMVILYHEGFKLMGIAKPEMNLPIQLVGMLVALFGVGYLAVNRNPLENRSLLRLGFCSKALGPVLATGYIMAGLLPWTMLIVLFFADLIYLVPFYLIDRQIGQLRSTCQPAAVTQTHAAQRRAA